MIAHAVPDGVWPILATPFHDDGSVDFSALDDLVAFYVGTGVSGLFALGSSSEFLLLTPEERLDVVRRAIAVSDGHLPIVAAANYGRSLVAQAASLSQYAELGVAAAVVSTSILPRPENLDEQLLHLGELTDVPLGIYECPIPEKRVLTPHETGRVAASGRYVMMKDTCRDMDAFRTKVEMSRGTPLKIFQANWKLCLASLEAGANGFCGIVPMVEPELASQVCRADADPEEQQGGHAALLHLQSVMIAHHYPASVKYMLQKRGVAIGVRCRVESPEVFTRADRQAIDDYMRITATD